jgi:TonB family protein
MFQSTFVGGGDDARKPLSFLVSILSQTVFVCVLILVPLLTSPALPTQRFVSFLLAPPSPPPPAPPALPQIAAVAAPTEVFDDRLIAPKAMPDQAKEIIDPPERSVGVVGLDRLVSGPTGVEGGVIASMIGREFAPLPPKPSPAPVVEKVQPRLDGPVRVHSTIQQAKLLRKIAPQYPRPARDVRVQGTVQLNAIIATDGTIRSIKLISGHPFLAKAAIDAVKQWRYAPTLLNGEPVEVATRIDVNFKLQ